MNPQFQHSIIPSPQDICLPHSHLLLTLDGGIFDWPIGLGFLCLLIAFKRTILTAWRTFYMADCFWSH